MFKELGMMLGEAQIENTKLKAENEKLKEDKQNLIKDWEEEKNLAYEIACKNEKLKQTLTEIEKIVRVCLCSASKDYYGIRMKQILDKISEVKNVANN